MTNEERKQFQKQGRMDFHFGLAMPDGLSPIAQMEYKRGHRHAKHAQLAGRAYRKARAAEYQCVTTKPWHKALRQR